MQRSKSNFKVGVVQATPALFNLDSTIAIVIEWIEKAAEAECEFVLFPESFIPCYPRGLAFDAVIGRRTDRSREVWAAYWNNSITLASSEVLRISEAIRKAGIFVALGVTEKANLGASLYCSIIYFDKYGDIQGVHRKLKPTGLERMIWGEGDGAGLIVVDDPLAKIGGLICWENYMPLARTALYEQGVEIYLAPTADTRETWLSTLRHIALEGRCFVLSSNQFVKRSDYPDLYKSLIEGEDEILCNGGSAIISPLGEVLQGPVWGREELLIQEIDLSVIVKSKMDFDPIGHYARKDIFEFTINRK